MSPLKSLVSEIATDIPILVIDPEFAVFVIKFGFPVFWGFWVFWVLYSIKFYFLVRFFMAIVLLWSLGLLSFSLCSSFLNEEIYTEWFQIFRTHAEKGLLSLHFTLIHMQLLPLLQPSLKEEALLLALLISVTQHLNITAAAPQNPSVIAATGLLDSSPSTVWSSDDESGLAQPFTASHPLGLLLTCSSGCTQLAPHHCRQMASSCSSQLPTKRSMLLISRIRDKSQWP